jgi:CO/xanthine dehydrogenase FAD-binding subunit
VYPEPIAEYHAPRTVAEVLDLLQRQDRRARILAGGQSLMQQLKARSVGTDLLIDINRVAGLDSIAADDRGLALGALVRFAVAASHPALEGAYAALAEAAAAIGDRQVRNRGTLVGSIAFGAHWGDIAPAAAALDGELVIARRQGGAGEAHRSAPLAAHALARDELIVALRLPPAAPGSGSCYLKHGRVAQDRATLGVAAAIVRDRAGRCLKARLAVGGLAGQPFVHAHTVEALVAGKLVDDALLETAGAEAARAIATVADELASADYRTQLLRIYVPRALALAHARGARDAA